MADRNIESLAFPLYIGNAANRMKVATDGTISFEGNATVYEDITGNINGSSLYSTAGKADYDWSEDFVILQPSGSLATVGDIINIKFQLKHSMKQDSPLKLHIHWRQTSQTTVFTYRYRVQNNLSPYNAVWSNDISVSATGAANAVAYVSGSINQITTLGDIQTTGIAISSIVQVKLVRTDATVGDVYVYDIDAHYEIDSVGSTTEYLK